MERAGYEVFKFIKNNFRARQSIIVLCGPGNNGGDGFIIAKHLIKEGYRTEVYSYLGKKKYKGDALKAQKSFQGTVKKIELLKIHANAFLVEM